MLSDCDRHRKLDQDPAPALERQMNTKLLPLYKESKLPQPLHSKLMSSGRTPLFMWSFEDP
jgi:hypothetical protein